MLGGGSSSCIAVFIFLKERLLKLIIGEKGLDQVVLVLVRCFLSSEFHGLYQLF